MGTDDISDAFSTGTALYYPYIHPRNLNQVKAALLFWDRVRRIVPDSLVQEHGVIGDSADIKALVDHKLLITTGPAPYEENASERFLRHIEPRKSKFLISLDAARELVLRNKGIHEEKFGDELIYKLQGLGVAHRLGKWVGMRDEVGAFYMYCLAAEMGTRIKAPLLAASIDDSSLGKALLFEPDSSADVSEVLLEVGIRFPGPDALQHVPLRDIIQFAERRGTERQRFRQEVQGIINIARSKADANAIADYLESQKVMIREAVDALWATLDELGVGETNSYAKITIPAGIAAGLAALPFSTPAAAILSSTGFALEGC